MNRKQKKQWMKMVFPPSVLEAGRVGEGGEGEEEEKKEGKKERER